MTISHITPVGVPVVLPTPDPEADAMDQIEGILVADYPAEEPSIRAWVAKERSHPACHPIWLYDEAYRDSSVTDDALEQIRDVIDALPSPCNAWDWTCAFDREES